MNPFTRSLLQKLDDRKLRQFVEAWDQLEVLIIQVYKSGEALPADETAYERTCYWLSRHYPRWQPDLSRYWLELGLRPKTSPLRLSGARKLQRC